MSEHLKRAIERLKAKLLSLCTDVEERLRQAVKSIDLQDGELARQVIDTDEQIDHMEVKIEEECLKILALYQPVAIDLRFIITVLKINNDLERIGDLAVNIAERSEFHASREKIDILLDFDTMVHKTQAMLRNSLKSLVDMDCRLARQVCVDDNEVDDLNREMYNQVKDAIRSRPDGIESLIHLLEIARDLERIADHATNIAEDVIYMAEGEIVRHKAEDYK